MPVRNLEKLFRPASIAVFGASNEPRSIGHRVMRNLLEGGFEGPIMPVNPEASAAGGVLTYPDAQSLPLTPDLAVVCTPPTRVPDLIEQLGHMGTRAAIVLGGGPPRACEEAQCALRSEMLRAARVSGMRILGPNCLGVLVPASRLNASRAHLPALAGRVAFVSQSGALSAAVLDWARAHDIGFSHFVSMGDSMDLDFGDVIDYLGSESGTQAILLYIESIRERRNFMSAARAAARNKPVLVIKSGRDREGARAAASHTGALAGSDAVFDAAIRRAGMLRVQQFEELFSAVETLARARPLRGERLAIVSNGGGLGVIAVDALEAGGGQLAEISAATLEKLAAELPTGWSRNNPVDMTGEAAPALYGTVLHILAEAREVDAVLFLHAPTAATSSEEAARALVVAARGSRLTVLTSWVGEEVVTPARRLFAAHGLPAYPTPAQGVGAFLHMAGYRRNQELLIETPPSVPAGFTPAVEDAHEVIRATLGGEPRMLNEPDSKRVLAAYGIPAVRTRIARDGEDAAAIAQEMGFPVAVKVLSPDVSHKADVGGVELFVDSAEAVRAAAARMQRVVGQRLPDARIDGFTVQEMAVRPGAYELIVGVSTDPLFGPVILFGHGGTAAEVIRDRAVALPPLNMTLARELISRTRIWQLLRGYRERPPVNLDALCTTLIRISQLVIDRPEISELDINPLLADEDGVLALDARIEVARPARTDQRLAIRPYPAELEEPFRLRDGREVLLRPIRPEDEPEHRAFISKLTPQDIRFRFFGVLREVPHSQLARFTQIDYDREMAFIATAPGPDASPETLGVVRTVTDPDNERAEFAIVVRSDLQGQGLGKKLLEKMIEYCRSRGTRVIIGQVLNENKRMLDLVHAMGFATRFLPGEDAVEVELEL